MQEFGERANTTQESPKQIRVFPLYQADGHTFEHQNKNAKEISYFIRSFFHKIFCFGYNFLTDVIFSNPFSQVIYILKVLCSYTHIDHIYGHIMSGPNDQFQQNSHNSCSCMGLYSNEHGQYQCLCKEQEICSQPAQAEWNKSHW